MPRARKPALSPAMAARNARARSLGYSSYYDYRIHDHGRIPPSRPPLPKGTRDLLRGHRSGAGAGFLRRLREGDLVILTDPVQDVLNGIYTDRRGTERLPDYEKTVIPASGKPTWEFTFRRQTLDELERVIADELRIGAAFSLAPSLDQRRLQTEYDHFGTEEPAR